MLFNNSITIYQATGTFEHGEVSSGYTSAGTLYCHIKLAGNDQLSGDRKKAIRRAKLYYEVSPVTLSVRDIVAVDGVVYHLQYTPLSRVGLGGRTIYEVDIVEDFKGEISL